MNNVCPFCSKCALLKMIMPYLRLHFLPHRILPSFWKTSSWGSNHKCHLLGVQRFPSHERVMQMIIIIQALSASGIILANELWGSLELQKGTALHVHWMNLMLTVHCSLHRWVGGGKRFLLSSGSAHQCRWIQPQTFSWEEHSFAVAGFSYSGTHFVSYKKAAVSLDIWMQN